MPKQPPPVEIAKGLDGIAEAVARRTIDTKYESDVMIPPQVRALMDRFIKPKEVHGARWGIPLPALHDIVDTYLHVRESFATLSVDDQIAYRGTLEAINNADFMTAIVRKATKLSDKGVVEAATHNIHAALGDYVFRDGSLPVAGVQQVNSPRETMLNGLINARNKAHAAELPLRTSHMNAPMYREQVATIKLRLGTELAETKLNALVQKPAHSGVRSTSAHGYMEAASQRRSLAPVSLDTMSYMQSTLFSTWPRALELAQSETAKPNMPVEQIVGAHHFLQSLNGLEMYTKTDMPAGKRAMVMAAAHTLLDAKNGENAYIQDPGMRKALGAMVQAMEHYPPLTEQPSAVANYVLKSDHDIIAVENVVLATIGKNEINRARVNARSLR